MAGQKKQREHEKKLIAAGKLPPLVDRIKIYEKIAHDVSLKSMALLLRAFEQSSIMTPAEITRLAAGMMTNSEKMMNIVKLMREYGADHIDVDTDFVLRVPGLIKEETNEEE